MKTLFKEKRIPHVNNLINHFPWVPRDCKELRTGHVQPHTKTKDPAVQEGGGVLYFEVRLSLVRRLINLLPVAQWTKL